MKPEQFDILSQQENPNSLIVQQLALAYGTVIPNTVAALCAMSPDGEFFDGVFCRKLSIHEILNGKEVLHVDFPEKGLLPIFDCGDNDFIVYRISDGRWIKFNIVEELGFRESSDWKTLI